MKRALGKIRRPQALPSALSVASLLALLASLLLPMAPAVARDIPVTAKHVISDDFQCNHVTSADLDRDGDLDILASSWNEATVAWWENAGGGTFATMHVIDDAFGNVSSAHAADIDGDGDLDVLASSNSLDTIAWWENDGQGAFATSHVITDTFNAAQNTHIADLDGDGDLDVIGVTYSGYTSTWWENAGDGTFPTAHDFEDTYCSPRSISSADLDRDGDVDILGTAGGTYVLWWENAGDGSILNTHIISDSLPMAGSAHPVDLDRDGDLDVMAISHQFDIVAWFENTAGDASAWTQHVLTDTLGSLTRVNTADVDADGDADVLGVSKLDDQIAWGENDGDGSIVAVHLLPDIADEPTSVHCADMDGDGDLDILGAAYGGNGEIAWWENDTIHRSATYPLGVLVSDPFEKAYDVYAADLDGDSDLDILGAAYEGDDLSWWNNLNGDGSAWAEHIIVEDTLDGPFSIRTADFDGDGDLDVVANGHWGGQLSWWENDGDGGGWIEHKVDDDLPSVGKVRVADLDGDADADILTVAEPEFVWYENDFSSGTFTFTKHTIQYEWAQYANAIDAADVDGDGDLDAIGAAWNTGKIYYWENQDGTGTLWGETVVRDGWQRPNWVTSVDLDRDGDVDILGSAEYDGDVLWWENDGGDGSSWIEHAIDTEHDGAISPYAADLDQDGDLDVACAAMGGDAPDLTWWENDGTNDGWTEHVVAEDIDDTKAVYAADMNRDGDLDLLVACWAYYSDENIYYWENRGGQFALQTSDTAPAALLSGEMDDLLRVYMHHRGRPGDRDEELATLELLFERTPGTPLSSEQANALIETLYVYLDDDGSGIFDPIYDTRFLTMTTLTLTDGLQTIAFDDNNENLRVAHGTSRAYFVVAALDPAAYYQTPHQFRVTHLTENSSTAEDWDFDLPLLIEWAADVASTVVVAEAEADLGAAKTGAPAEFVPGEAVTYTLVISNGGPSDALGAQVVDDVPYQVSDVTWSCTATGGASCPPSGAGSIDETVDVTVDGAITFTVVGTLQPWVTNPVVNEFSVSASPDVTDPVYENNIAAVTHTVTPQADLDISKTSQLQASGAITYTIVAINDGPSDCPAAVVVDDLPAEIVDVTWSCAAGGGASCDPSGAGDIDESVDLPTGGQVIYTVWGTVDSRQTITNTAGVTVPAGVLDPEPGNNSASQSDRLALFYAYLPLVYKNN
ncbi:MAG: VCBS repeat-containing protein [Chloroflexia bacterium]|nr:VCBS repeat-containing protein [Chloroflexia bacterium]